MIVFLDGGEARMCDGCHAWLDGSVDGAILNGRGDYCDTRCASRALSRKREYRCPDCVQRREESCEHRAVTA